VIERPDVDALFAGPLGAWLAEQTAVRNEARRVSNRRFLIAAVIGIGAVGLTLAFAAEWIEFVAFGAFAAGAAWGYAPRGKAIKDTKRGINHQIARALGLTYADEFEPGRGFALAQTYRMVPNFDRDSFEDLWMGEMGGHPFTVHEAHLEERRGSGKNRRWVTVFRGAIVTFVFNRDFHGTTLVERQAKHRKFFGGEKDFVEFDGHRLDSAAMVSPEFEDLFTVWTDDQTEARYLVHPRYIERLVEVERAFGGQNIRTLFHGGELAIVIESGDMFESGSLDADKDRELVARTCDQFMTLVGLCEALNEPAR
jgi:hypothetical protein